MSGYGADDTDYTKDVTESLNTPPEPTWDPFSTTGGATAGPWATPETQVQTEVEQAEKQFEASATESEKSWWDDAKKYLTPENAAKALSLAQQGISIANAVKSVVTGSPQPAQQPVSYLPPPTPLGPIPVDPYANAGLLTMKSTGFWKAALGPQYAITATKQLQEKKNTMLLIGAAVVAFLVLSKK
jgi:hypothetical protein